MFKGVDHIGVGVGDMDDGDRLLRPPSASATCCSTTPASVPGTEAFTGRQPRRARVAMLSNPRRDTGRARRASSSCRCSTATGRRRSPPGQAWGEVGVCEVCLHVRDVDAVHERLVALPGGGDADGAARAADGGADDVSLDIAYVADPWGGEARDDRVDGPLEGRCRASRAAEGVNHVAFGVADHRRERARSTGGSGFDEMLFESTDFFDPMAPWYEAGYELPDAAHDDDDVVAGRRRSSRAC